MRNGPGLGLRLRGPFRLGLRQLLLDERRLPNDDTGIVTLTGLGFAFLFCVRTLCPMRYAIFYLK